MRQASLLGWGLAGLTVVLALFAWFWFSRGYGDVSPRGYEYAVAIFSACNQSDEAKLDKISQMVAESLRLQEISLQESQWLNAIIDRGKRGDWKAASREVRRLMEDQVKSAPPPE